MVRLRSIYRLKQEFRLSLVSLINALVDNPVCNTPEDTIIKKVKKTNEAPQESNLGHLLGHHLRRAHLSIWRDFNDNVGHGGLRPGQFGVMSTVDQNPGISQIEISRILDLDKASIVALIYRLENLAWVEKKQAKEDRRKHQLYLTAKGKKELKTLRKDMQKHEAKFQKRFSDAEYTKLIALLQRIYEGND